MKHYVILCYSVIVCAIVLLSGSIHAQQDTGKHIAFEQFSFMLDPLLASNLNIMQFHGDSIDETYPGGPQPPHTQFLLYTELPTPELMLQSAATINVYTLADMEGYEAHVQHVETLQNLLAELPELKAFEQVHDSLSEITLPFLPIMSGAQVLRAHSEYVNTDAVSGIAYLTVYRQDVAPFLADEFIYTFQGLSDDGNYYISIVMPVRASMFDETLPTDYNFQAFIATMTAYFNDSVVLLNDARDNDFAPALTVAHTLIDSLSIGSNH